ncbi:hypothetical protein GIB67_024182 [Kingdonia uniflora]|uniref:non-specific serine/threonine protein kinase n=1 Tax=Kingdonia uniflora TaxID=39325 RepID=A0A7J7LZH6_9MAGN|nr:hypothetical protein GIB67_024182 [Kingdonia uniflora]
MGSYPGICEIVESNEDLNLAQYSKVTDPSNTGARLDEKLGKLPMLKTGRNHSVENDLNQLFEAIDRRNSVRALALSQQPGAGVSSKNAMKKPIRVGVSQASGIGISESVSLKQALRGLCISHASEMAALKRLSKPIGSPGTPESGAIKRLYRALVVETSESGITMDEGESSLVEISIMPEKCESNSSENIRGPLQERKSKSLNPSANTSPRFGAIYESPHLPRKKSSNLSANSSPRFGVILESSQTTRTKSTNPSANSSPLFGGIPESSQTPRTKSANPSANSSPRFGAISESSQVHRMRSSNQSAHTSPRFGVIPESVEVPRIKSLNPTAHSSLRPVVPKTVTTKKLQIVESVPKSTVGGKGSPPLKLKPGYKGKLKNVVSLSNSKTIKKVLEVDEIDPEFIETRSKSSPKLAPIDKLDSTHSLSASSTGSQVCKSVSNSPRVVKPTVRHKGFIKRKVKHNLTSTSNSSNTCNDVDNDVSVPSTSKLVCRMHNCNQDNSKKESSSPASINSNNAGPRANKGNFSSTSQIDGTLHVKTSDKSRSREKGEFSQSSKSSIGEYSSSTSISEESCLSGTSSSGNRPHMSKDLRWEAIHFVELRHGSLGLKNFNLLKRLGCGDIGTVYLAELAETSGLFALKVMDNEFLASRKKMPRAQTEREILQMLDHPFLPTLYAHFTTDKFSCLVMEYCPGGDLHVLRQRQSGRSFSESAAKFYVAEVLLALEYLHMLGVVYRDLKPENILVREDGHIMLSDFDLSLRCNVNPTLVQSCPSIIEPVKKSSGPCAESSCIKPFCIQPSWAQPSCFSPRITSATPRTRKLKADFAAQVSPLPQLVAEPTSARSNSFVGTHEYLAPEIIKGDGHGSAVDWWTFGIFLYELLFGKTPFKGSGNEGTLVNVVSETLRFPDTPLVSFQARDLMRGLLMKDPENRLGSVRGATEIKRHPFFEGLNWALIRCAIPPETPKFCDPVDPQKTESKYGEHLEFELF